LKTFGLVNDPPEVDRFFVYWISRKDAKFRKGATILCGLAISLRLCEKQKNKSWKK